MKYKGDLNKDKGKKIILHVKPRYVSSQLNFNSESEGGPSEGDGTDILSKHANFDDSMASIDKATVQFLHNLNICINVLKFVLGCIPSFDAKIFAMKNNFDKNPSSLIWRFFNKCSI